MPFWVDTAIAFWALAVAGECACMQEVVVIFKGVCKDGPVWYSWWGRGRSVIAGGGDESRRAAIIMCMLNLSLVSINLEIA